ncbi:MAG: DUF952 domain-containing protein [Gemmataceae bacterium]
MKRIYHLVTPDRWPVPSGNDYLTDSLASEGFIHCSFADQVEGSANRYYGQASELLLLEIDPQRLNVPLKIEPSGSGALFPHLYGPLHADAVIRVHRLQRESGRWVFLSQQPASPTLLPSDGPPAS